MAHEVLLQCEDLTEKLEDVYKEQTTTSISVLQEVQKFQVNLSRQAASNSSIWRSPEQGVVTPKVQHHRVQELFCVCLPVKNVPTEAPSPKPEKRI